LNEEKKAMSLSEDTEATEKAAQAKEAKERLAAWITVFLVAVVASIWSFGYSCLPGFHRSESEQIGKTMVRAVMACEKRLAICEKRCQSSSSPDGR